MSLNLSMEKRWQEAKKRQWIQTLGFFGFLVVNEQPITFRRFKSKELLAYLVDRRGADITTRRRKGSLGG